MKLFIKKHSVKILLILLILFHIVCNIIWIAEDRSFPLWDMAGHTSTSVTFFRLLSHPSFLNLKSILTFNSIYPPFVYLVTVLFYFVFGLNIDVPLYSNLIFIIILLLSTYGIGKELYNLHIGLLSAFLVSIYPLVTRIIRIYKKQNFIK